MVELKSDTISEHFKIEGNRNFAKKLYYNALISWNKVIFKILSFHLFNPF
jgi:hypothetical protein